MRGSQPLGSQPRLPPRSRVFVALMTHGDTLARECRRARRGGCPFEDRAGRGVLSGRSPDKSGLKT